MTLEKMKKITVLALALVLALIPATAFAFTGSTVAEAAPTPITLAAALVDYQEGPFGVAYSKPPTTRQYIVNERVAVLLEITVPEGYDTDGLTISTDAAGIVIEPHTVPIKSGQYILYGRLTSASATLEIAIKDTRVATTMGTITAKGHTVAYEPGKYTIDNILTIHLSAEGRGESMTITHGGAEYTAAVINGAVGFVGDAGNILVDSPGYAALAKTFNGICKDLGLDLSNVGNYVPASHFLKQQADRGTKAKISINPFIASITVPELGIEPPKTGDGPSIIGLAMILAAVLLWGCRRWAK